MSKFRNFLFRKTKQKEQKKLNVVYIKKPIKKLTPYKPRLTFKEWFFKHNISCNHTPTNIGYEIAIKHIYKTTKFRFVDKPFTQHYEK